ncbi:MAG: hypothetical protein KY469_10660 [Actinobacteria bacterium]|nr:hypothetical protein [Actinomycetota bacterium]
MTRFPEIEWVDAVPPVEAGRDPIDWGYVVGLLRAHPGRWGRVRCRERQAASSAASRLRALGLQAHSRAGDVYARWVADQEESA